jgi:hypothetical protein
MRRLESGLPPTETAHQEWENMEKRRKRETIDRQEREQRKILESQLPTTGVKTSALPRPNSYMPTDIRKHLQFIIHFYV